MTDQFRSDAVLATMAKLEQLPFPAGLIEVSGRVLFSNRAGTVLLGRSRDSLVGRLAWELAPGGEHVWPELVASARRDVYEGQITLATPNDIVTVHYVAGMLQREQLETLVLLATAKSSYGDPLPEARELVDLARAFRDDAR